VDVEYSSAFICILTGYLGIVYQRVKFKGQLFIELCDFDSKKLAFARFCGRFFVMTFLSALVFMILNTTIPTIIQPIDIWEIYFILVLIPFLIGPFLAFAFGDWLCLKLRLYKESNVFGLDSS
jgi:hypothetical protein